MRRILSISIVLLGVAVSAPLAFGAFDRLIDPNCSDESDCAYWTPKLPPLKGWHVDEDDSKQMRSRVLVPDGTKGEAAAIYASALRTIDLPDGKQSIPGMIAKEREDAESLYPGSTFADGPDLRSGDGKAVKTQTSVPPAEGEFRRWRRYAYLKEGDLYVTFEVSANSKDELDAHMKAFEQLIASYKAKL